MHVNDRQHPSVLALHSNILSENGQARHSHRLKTTFVQLTGIPQ